MLHSGMTSPPPCKNHREVYKLMRVEHGESDLKVLRANPGQLGLPRRSTSIDGTYQLWQMSPLPRDSPETFHSVTASTVKGDVRHPGRAGQKLIPNRRGFTSLHPIRKFP